MAHLAKMRTVYRSQDTNHVRSNLLELVTDTAVRMVQYTWQVGGGGRPK